MMIILNDDPDLFWNKLEKMLEKASEKKEPTKHIWLRSADVREMLQISDSTLQTLRVKGIIPAYRLGDSWFYKEDEILAALEAGRNEKGGNK